jgi:tRNA 2-thiouridine synthesizing protein A
VKLDCTGQRCPQPVIALARLAKASTAGTVIHITTDDPAAAVDVPAWCRMRRHDCLLAADCGGTLTHTVVIGGS